MKRLYALCSLRKAGLNCDDLVLVYCSLVRSIIECASPVWAVLPAYLEDLLESIQRKALRIIFGKIECADAMAKASVDTFKARRVVACQKFILNARQHPTPRTIKVNIVFVSAIRDPYLAELFS